MDPTSQWSSTQGGKLAASMEDSRSSTGGCFESSPDLVGIHSIVLGAVRVRMCPTPILGVSGNVPTFVRFNDSSLA
jgi:hypothetical protein